MSARAASEEKRAYWRLLRHLLSDEIGAAYSEKQPEELPPDMEHLLGRLDDRTAGRSDRGGD